MNMCCGGEHYTFKNEVHKVAYMCTFWIYLRSIYTIFTCAQALNNITRQFFLKLQKKFLKIVFIKKLEFALILKMIKRLTKTYEILDHMLEHANKTIFFLNLIFFQKTNLHLCQKRY